VAEGTDAGADVATVDISELGVLDTSPGGGDAPTAADFRSKLVMANRALRNSDLDRAEQLYRAVLAKDPDNTEAIAGLGDVARLRNDPDSASKMYDKVLEKNPSYLPALAARADQKWASGDRAGAIVLYRRIVEQAGPNTPYGQRAAARIAQGAGGSQPPAPAPTPSPPPAQDAGVKPAPKPAPEPAPAPAPPPHIDTTDLPEYQ
jgi:tetratricopeptide (TPR) repeat protein